MARKPAAKKKAETRKKPAPKRKFPVKKPDPSPVPSPEPVTETQSIPEPKPDPTIAVDGGLTVGEAPIIPVPDFDDERSDLAPGAEPESALGSPETDAGGRVTKEQFFQMFRACFAAPNAVMLARSQPALKSLSIDADNQSARSASDALYDICAETEMLRWLLEPGSKWTQRLIVIAAFAVPTLQAAVLEYRGNLETSRADNARPVNPEAAPKPAPEQSDLAGFEVEIENV